MLLDDGVRLFIHVQQWINAGYRLVTNLVIYLVTHLGQLLKMGELAWASVENPGVFFFPADLLLEKLIFLFCQLLGVGSFYGDIEIWFMMNHRY